MLGAALVLLVACSSPDRTGRGASPRPDTARSERAGELVGGFSDGASLLGRSEADLGRELDAIAAIGATYLRIDVYWAQIERRRGELDWATTDRIVDAARSRGLEILGVLDYSPAWARPPGTDDHSPPSNPADYANFARAAVRRYAPRGVHVWEIWNEPNITAFWKPRPDPSAYAELLAAAYPAIKSADRDATVVSGGLSPAPDAADGSAIPPVRFLEAVYAAGGGGKFDAVGHHPSNYPRMPLTPEPGDYNRNAFGGVTPALHETMQENGDGAKRIWATEMGAPTPYGGMTPEYLAEYIREAYSAWGSWPFTGPLIWYAYRDAGTNPDDIEDHFGVTYADLRPKQPAHRAITSILQR